MMVRAAFLCGFFAVWCLGAQVHADDAGDCTRYRIAGLPCPTGSAGARGPVLPRTPAVAALSAVSSPPRIAPLALVPAPVPVPPLNTLPVSSAGGYSPTRDTPTVLSPAPLAAPAPPAAPVSMAGPSRKPLGPGAGGTLQPLSSMPALSMPREGREPGQIVVYWSAADEGEAALASLLQVRGMAPVSTTRLEHLGGVIAVFQLPGSAAAAEFREQLRKEFPGAVVDFNTRYRPLLQPDVQPRIYLPQKADQPNVNTDMPGAPGIRIGIVDGPVARAAALMGVSIIRKNFLLDTDIAAPKDHATAIAALIAGRDPRSGFVGIAPRARLYSAEIMRAIGPDDVTTSASLVRALDWLLAEKVQLINLSLGGSGDSVMERAFSRLVTLAVVVVAAAGNGGPAAPPAYPAAYPGVIAVTATDGADRLYAQANQGNYITLAAPGVDIWVPDAEFGHYVSGTSFAAAVVTGAGALLLAQNPLRDPKTMAQRLCRGARDLGAKGADAVFGCGLIQIRAALREDRS